MIPRKSLLGMAALLVLLSLAACDSSATPTPGLIISPGGSPTPVAPSPSAPTPDASRTVITMETTGGVAGMHKTLEVSQGKAKYTSGTISKEAAVPPATYNSLLQEVHNADFFKLSDSYDKGGVADDIYYNITVNDGSRTKTIKVAQVGGKAVTPKALQHVISQLTTIQSGIEK